MRVHADQAKCVGAGNCVALAPAVFDQNDDDGIVRVVNEHPDESQRSTVEEAVDFCPAQAIWLTED